MTQTSMTDELHQRCPDGPNRCIGHIHSVILASHKIDDTDRQMFNLVHAVSQSGGQLPSC